MTRDLITHAQTHPHIEVLIRACGLHVEETALDALFQKESAA